jgi:lysozyme family protein
MTEDRLIDDTFRREGDVYGDEQSRPPIDQPTGRGGIALGTLRRYVVATGSALPATVDTLKALTHDQARDIVRWALQDLARAQGIDRIPFAPLRLQVLDFAYNSGPALAIRWLQRVLGVPRTGQMDPITVAAVLYPDLSRVQLWIHQSLVAARLEMIDRAADGGTIQRIFEDGLEHRALSFSLLEVP